MFKYIPAPENKKYGRLTIACLVVIALMKPVYTIEEISRLIQLGIDFKDAEISSGMSAIHSHASSM